MELFAIHCTTCKARLIVKDESVIGDILSCPKCHSMVQIVPPPGWSSPSVSQQPALAAKPTPAPTAKRVPAKAAPTNAAVAPAKMHATPPSIAASLAPPALPPRVSTSVAAAAIDTPAAPVDVTSVPSGEPAAEIVAAGKPRDWTHIAAGIGGGVLLGAIGWLVIWLASPDEVSVASTPTATAQGAAPEETPAPSAAARVPADKPPAPVAPTTEAQPLPTATDAVTSESLPAGIPVADLPTSVEPTEEPAADAALAERPSTPTTDPQPELKLDPVAPQPAAPTDADPAADSLGEAAADDEPAGNTDAQPATDENLPAVVDASPGEPAPLPVAEIQRRLGVGISRVDFSGVPLGHLAAFLSDVSGARVVLDETSLARSGKGRKTPVTVKLTGGTALAILEAAAEQAGLDYKIEPDRITLSGRGP